MNFELESCNLIKTLLRPAESSFRGNDDKKKGYQGELKLPAYSRLAFYAILIL
jgi:hypothetical protein